MKELQIISEYECFPFGVRDNSDQILDNVPVDDIRLPKELKSRIKTWDKIFQDTYDRKDGRNSGFKTAKEEDSYEKEGLAIWHILMKELKLDYRVFYFSYKTNLLLSPE